jgi:hypothetical protein
MNVAKGEIAGKSQDLSQVRDPKLVAELANPQVAQPSELLARHRWSVWVLIMP